MALFLQLFPSPAQEQVWALGLVEQCLWERLWQTQPWTPPQFYHPARPKTKKHHLQTLSPKARQCLKAISL
jgi:hypothetical protein